MNDWLVGRGRACTVRGLDVLLALALLVATLVLWRSSLSAGGFTALRPDDVVTAGLVLLAIRCWLCPLRWPAIAPGRLVGTGVAVYALTFAFITIGRHRTFQTHALDLGQYAQSMWQIARGQPPYDTVTGWHVWGNHFSPVFYLLALGTLLFSGPAWLLAFQSLALALGALPLYPLARRHLSAAAAAAVALLYLVNPSLHGINLRDVHPAALAIPLLLTAMYAWEADRRPLFALATILTLATREDAAVAVVGLGLWLAIARRHWVAGGAVAAVSVAWLVATVHWLMPSFRDDAAYPYVAAHYGHLGGSLGAIALSPLLRPRAVLVSLRHGTRLRYLLTLLAPLGFLPLLAPPAAIGALPGIAQNALGDYAVLLNYRSQYQSFVLPFLLVATVMGLARLERGPLAGVRWITSRRALVVAALASLVLTARTVNSLAVHGWKPGPEHQAAHRLIAMIPPGVTVSTTERFFPHLYDRAVPFVFPDRVAASEYVLLNSSTLPQAKLEGRPARRDGDTIVVTLPGQARARLRVIAEDHALLLLRPDH